ncbi:hypothetical protein HC031_29485 [Planosporangium thailandense]|uniref:Phospholipase C n=1 Tax=Planosporangium thailandense TaxID=765197 RepID=A0ABX0Y5X8_9ACTN|nr:hypothetical protein [Planosporangium thailandense]
MKRSSFTGILFRGGAFLSVLLMAIVTGDARAGSAHPKPPPGGPSPIQHIIFIVQENRSFDSYFGAFPGANGAATGRTCTSAMTPCPTGAQGTVPLHDLVDTSTHMLPNFAHSWSSAHRAYDLGAMDKFNQASGCGAPAYACYVRATKSDIPNYWALAQRFVLGDNAYSSVMGPSFPNHLYTVAARSGPEFVSTNPRDSSVIDNPVLNGSEPRIWGCDANPNATVQTLTAASSLPPSFPGRAIKPPPCWSNSQVATLASEMNAHAGSTWKYYVPNMRESNDSLASFRDVNVESTTAHPNGIDMHPTGFTDDVRNNHLPQFSWLSAPHDQNEHPGQSTSCQGENWVTERINAVMNNPTVWNSSVIVVTWDDYGGLYDHVPPMKLDGVGLGFRVPFLIISPYAEHKVSHRFYDFTSVLKYAEAQFLGRTTPGLSARESQVQSIEGDLNFAATPIKPMTLPLHTCH